MKRDLNQLRGPLRPGIARGIIFSQRALKLSAIIFLFICFSGPLLMVTSMALRTPRGSQFPNWLGTLYAIIAVLDFAILISSLAVLITLIVFFVARYTIAQVLTIVILGNVFATIAVSVPEFCTGALASLLSLAILIVVFVLNQYPTERELHSALNGESAS